MPIYEYRCAQCGHELEIMQKMVDDPLKTCPECQHHSLDKLISRSSFRLKGGGWYETDFKNPDAKKNSASSPETNTPHIKPNAEAVCEKNSADPQKNSSAVPPAETTSTTTINNNKSDAKAAKTTGASQTPPAGNQ